jgi:hypothetical protein
VQVLETTDGHPFWVVTDDPDLERAARDVVDENGVWLYHENVGSTEHGFWVEAKDLRAGDVFLGANGELSVLVSTERVQFDETIKVYNFTVDGNHNYFVIAKTDELGQTCILAHNATLLRYGSKAEADAAKATGKLAPQTGHNVPKRVLEPGGTTNVSDWSKKFYSHKMTLSCEDSVMAWLIKNATRPLGHPDGWAIPLNKLDEFNALIKSIIVTKRK